jgi:hypothetical protein
MKIKKFIAIADPQTFYFINLPMETRSSLPGSSTYTFIELKTFLRRIVEKFSGTIRDLADKVGTLPQILFEAIRPQELERPRPSFETLVSFETVRRLIKLYYELFLSKTATIH